MSSPVDRLPWGENAGSTGAKGGQGPLVSCRSLAEGMVVLRARGVDLEGLTEGLDIDLAALSNPRTKVAWSDFTVIADRVCDRVGGLEAYRDVVAAFADHSTARKLRALMRLASNLERSYDLVFRWLGPSIFPVHRCTVRQMDARTIEIDIEIREDLPGSLPFLYGAWGTATTLPRAHGLPDSRVDAEIGPHRAHLVVHLPPRVSLGHRARRWIGAIFDAPGAVEELVSQQEELQESYEALARSLEETRDRERRLQAEMKARAQDQEEIRRRNELLLHAQRMESVGRLVGGVAHDFNNILTAILGYTDLLIADAHGETDTEALGEIRVAAERAARLTAQLLTFGRKQQSPTTRIDLNALIEGLAGMLRRLLGDIDVRTHVPTSPTYVVGDRTQLEQVLINLAVNARDAMPDGGQLTVRAETVDDESAPIARLVVEDTGIGIEPDVVPRIFEPFFTTKGEQGTGLGMATVSGIVAALGGTIGVRSTLGEGTRFTIDLPLADGPCSKLVTEAEAVVDGVERGTILLIEDEPAIRSLVEHALERAGHVVVVAGDGATALALASAQKLDVVVSDVMLGAERGPTIVARIRSLQPEAQVLFVSGYADSSASEIPDGAPFMTKPFRMVELEAQIQELLLRRRA